MDLAVVACEFIEGNGAVSALVTFEDDAHAELLLQLQSIYVDHDVCAVSASASLRSVLLSGVNSADADSKFEQRMSPSGAFQTRTQLPNNVIRYVFQHHRDAALFKYNAANVFRQENRQKSANWVPDVVLPECTGPPNSLNYALYSQLKYVDKFNSEV